MSFDIFETHSDLKNTDVQKLLDENARVIMGWLQSQVQYSNQNHFSALSKLRSTLANNLALLNRCVYESRDMEIEENDVNDETKKRLKSGERKKNKSSSGTSKTITYDEILEEAKKLALQTKKEDRWKVYADASRRFPLNNGGPIRRMILHAVDSAESEAKNHDVALALKSAVASHVYKANAAGATRKIVEAILQQYGERPLRRSSTSPTKSKSNQAFKLAFDEAKKKLEGVDEEDHWKIFIRASQNFPLNNGVPIRRMILHAISTLSQSRRHKTLAQYLKTTVGGGVYKANAAGSNSYQYVNTVVL